MFGIFKKKQVKEESSKSWAQIFEDRKKQLEKEIPFIELGINNESVPIKNSDLMTISTLMGFAWQHVGMTESEAVRYAVWTFVLVRAGSYSEKESANITMDSAMSWGMKNGFMLKLKDSLYCKNKIIEYLTSLKK